MAGKAVAVAKAVVKKHVAKAKAAKKPVATKAVAKKPAAAKAVAKKPVVAKFNLNKLMMLIVRDAPKKGKKMMGGVKISESDTIRKLILDFIGKYRFRITTLLNKVDKRGIENDMTQPEITTDTSTPWGGSLNGLILHIYDNRIVNNADGTIYPDTNKLQGYLISDPNNYPKKDNHAQDKIVLDDIFMIVVIALCNVYGRLRITQNP
jgi:hypothetical protein